ncbi:MAG: DUF3604 domain-containing protein, partial [Pseudomonadota bacterium]
QGLQIKSRLGRNYVTLKGDAADKLTLSRHDSVPYNMYPLQRPGLDGDLLYRRLFIARVGERALQAGERVQFVLGANFRQITAPTSADPEHELRITTDTDGDGTFTRIAASPQIAIEPAAASVLSASIPAQFKRGEAIEVVIRAEDAFLNVDTAYTGYASIRDEKGRLLASRIPLRRGIGRAILHIDESGPQRLRLSTGPLAGRSNPARVFDELPRFRLYWGDLHGHTQVSDGLGPGADAYMRYGREVTGLDVVALTDHAHFDWPANIAAVKRWHEPGRYVTLLAQEAGARQDHMNLYYRRDDTPHLAVWQGLYDKFIEGAYRQYNADSPAQAITGPHHFSYDRGDERYPFDVWDDRIARLVEVYSSHGASEYLGNPRPLKSAVTDDPRKFMQHGLAQGLRFGVIGASDNHDSRPGRSTWGAYPGGMAGIWATSLTREAIWDGLWNYRVYGTSLDRIYLEFTINDEMPGSQLAPGQALDINAYVIGKEDKLTLTLVRDNQDIETVHTDNGVIDFQTRDWPKGGSHFYYLRVTQDNGERAWSTPIWVGEITASGGTP